MKYYEFSCYTKYFKHFKIIQKLCLLEFLSLNCGKDVLAFSCRSNYTCTFALKCLLRINYRYTNYNKINRRYAEYSVHP